MVKSLPEAKADLIVKSGIEEFSRYAYADANTDHISAAGGISKGLLYHYFGTKKKFYLYCLEYALDVLTQTEEKIPEGDFYRILFQSLEQKLRQCDEHPVETKLVSMASRECSREVKEEKDVLFSQYAAKMQTRSDQILNAAVAALKLNGADAAFAEQGLKIYSNALINRYLLLYQNTPEKFFSSRETIAREIKAYMDLMLYGIGKEAE